MCLFKTIEFEVQLDAYERGMHYAVSFSEGISEGFSFFLLSLSWFERVFSVDLEPRQEIHRMIMSTGKSQKYFEP